jgi:hypothetical protein
MALEERKARLRATLWQTLREQLSGETEAEDLSGKPPRLSGPWDTFFGEHSTWDQQPPLNRELYLDLITRFDDNLVREVLLAAADVKISRATLSDGKIALLREVAERHGFQVVTSEQRWILRADRGKGGWANRAERLAEPSEAGAVSNVYVASDTTLAETGRLLDEAGEDDLFGALLGIPACCREAFDTFKPLAAQKQYDFVPHVLENTSGAIPYDWRLNYLAQYFGCSLLSFFPCSFRCSLAAAVAEGTLSMLSHCDPTWAKRFVELQRTNVLYTENCGLHLFRARLCDGLIAYEQQDLQSSETTELADLLREGDRLEIGGKHAVHVYRGGKRIRELKGEDICMCAFH